MVPSDCRWRQCGDPRTLCCFLFARVMFRPIHHNWQISFHSFSPRQDPPPQTTQLGTFRRMLNAIRFRFTKRSRSKKPDWLLDKYPSRSRSKSTPSEEVSPTASTANILCSRLSVDPSLPSHYRVSRRIFQYQISPAMNTRISAYFTKIVFTLLSLRPNPFNGQRWHAKRTNGRDKCPLHRSYRSVTAESCYTCRNSCTRAAFEDNKWRSVGFE